MSSRRPNENDLKRTSRQMRDATLGTHVSRVYDKKPTRRTRGGDNRRGRGNTPGSEFASLQPRSTTGESYRAYHARMNKRAYFERSAYRQRFHRIIFGIVLLIIAVAVGVAIGWFVYVNNINGRLSLSDSTVASQLSEASTDGVAEGQTAPFYTLMATTLTDDGSEQALVLTKTDPSSSTVWAVGIPTDTYVSVDGTSETLLAAYQSGGYGAVISAVESLTGVEVNHFVVTDAAGLAQLVDDAGGVTVEVPEQIADTDVGDTVIEAGTQTLTGEQVLFACRADDYVAARQTQSVVQARAAEAVLAAYAGLSGRDYYVGMDDISKLIQTDVDLEGGKDLLAACAGIAQEGGTIYSAALPTYAATIDDASVQMPLTSEVSTMIDRINQGLSPQEDVRDIVGSVDPLSFTITVNNGGSVVGAAAEASQILEDEQFQVSEIGNTSMAVYDETLVIYQNTDDASKAEAVVAVLGRGRAVYDPVYYSFDTDILVVVGNDWPSVETSDGTLEANALGTATADAVDTSDTTTDSSDTTDTTTDATDTSDTTSTLTDGSDTSDTTTSSAA
jgi:LCP family protein required for cell wall assembly